MPEVLSVSMAALTDVRYSIRSLARTPGLTITLLVTIALGVGSNASVLSFINGLVARDLPVPEIERVVSIFARGEQDAYGPVSYDDYLSLKTQTTAFESVGAVRESLATVVIVKRSAIMSVAAMTPELFAVLRLPATDDVVISDRLWRAEFNARETVRGEAIIVDGHEHHVSDVAPSWLPGLYDGRAIDLWMPFGDASQAGRERNSRTLWVLGRLRANVSPRRLQDDVNAVRERSALVAVLAYTGAAPDVAGGLLRLSNLLPAAAVMVFIIACANVAGFLLSRGSGRSHETSVRVALGASRAQLGRQLLADSFVISAAGGIFGALAAVWAAHILPVMLYAEDAEQLVFSPDIWRVAIAAIVCIGITIACGLAPLAEVRDDDPAAVLRRESGGLSNAARRIRATLVVGQMTCCCLLLISTGLLFEGFRAALRTSLANRMGWPIIAKLEAGKGFAGPDRGFDFFRRAETAVRRTPGITSAAWVSALPGSRPSWQEMRIEPPITGWRDVMITVAAFPPSEPYVVTTPPTAGRMFGGRDAPGTCRVAMVNEEAAVEFFDGDAVGRSIEDASGERVEIIGVLKFDLKRRSTRPPRNPEAPRPTVYYYAEQTAPPLDPPGLARFRIPARPNPLSNAVLSASVVSASYFDVVGVAPIAGRAFGDDLNSDACRVGVLNPEAAEQYFGGNAVGGALIDPAGRRTEIVAVFPSPVLRTTQRQSPAAVYLPMSQNYLPRMTMIMGSQHADERELAAVRTALTGVGGGGTSPVVRTLDDHLSRTALAPERISALLVGACATTAIWLCLTGVYGAMADSVRQRKREIALRIALGAQGRRVIGQVLWEGLRLASAGAGAGLVGSLLVARWLARITPGAGVPTLWVWFAAPLILAVVVAAASVLPARKALTVDPLVIMRDAV